MEHHKLINSLIAEIRNLRGQIDSMQEWQGIREERMEQRNQQLRDRYDRSERERESERKENESRQWQRDDLQSQIDRAKRLGNDYKAEKLEKELRNI